MSPANLLVDAVLASPQGLTLSDLQALHPDIPRRTLQRRLAHAVGAGQLRAQGEARARRYVRPALTWEALLAASPLVVAAPVPSWAGGIPLSADSRDVWAYVEQPLQARRPVGYDLDFLDEYEPGLTWYLSASLRRQLAQMGRTAVVAEPAGTYSRAMLNRLLIDLSWASSHLEGNTYTRLDTRELIEHGRAAQGKDAVETQMILNHKAAIELLVENIAHADLDRFTLLNLHSALSENLLPNAEDEGRLRQHGVGISLSVYRPLSVPGQIEAAFTLMLDKVRRIPDPFEQAFFMMVHLPYLQPFADVNKRTSRLAANLPLFRANLCPLTFLDVPPDAYRRAMLGVYEMTRIELLRDLFVWAYGRSTQEYLTIRQNMAEPDPVRLAWRDLIKRTVRDVVQHPERDALSVADVAVATAVPDDQRAEVRSLIIEELRRLHEGVLARYGLRPSELERWRRAIQSTVRD